MQTLDVFAAAILDEDMRNLDAEVRAHAIQRSVLDAREASLLRQVDETRLWHWLGFPHVGAYVEDRLGLGPHAAGERIRVARELATLPAIEAALEAGAISFTHARELTRVATPTTEVAWLAAVEGKPAQVAQREVAGRGKGDAPDAPRKPELLRSRVWFDLSPARQALVRVTRGAADAECGQGLDDDAFFEALCRSFLERSGQQDASGTRPAYQVAITICRECQRGTVNGRGMEVDLTPAAVSRALCDAEVIGAIDHDDGARVTTSVTPRTRRRVMARDGYRCVVPGCRSARNLDLHHIVFQEHGGTHDASNIAATCAAHHAAVHDGRLSIRGIAPDLTFTFHRDDCLPQDCECAPPLAAGPRASAPPEGGAESTPLAAGPRTSAPPEGGAESPAPSPRGDASAGASMPRPRGDAGAGTSTPRPRGDASGASWSPHDGGAPQVGGAPPI